jgi:hypothetical protein
MKNIRKTYYIFCQLFLIIIFSFSTLAEAKAKDPALIFIEFYKLAATGKLNKAKSYISNKVQYDPNKYFGFITMDRKVKSFGVKQFKYNKEKSEYMIVLIIFLKQSTKERFIQLDNEKFSVMTINDKGKKIDIILTQTKSFKYPQYGPYFFQQFMADEQSYLMPFIMRKEEGKWKIVPQKISSEKPSIEEKQEKPKGLPHKEPRHHTDVENI